ncbi:ABC transporter, partial [Phytophthora megakarya]
MPHKGSSRGASASTKTRTAKPKSKPAKARGKASNRQEATSVASEATNTPGDTALSGTASPRRSRSASVPPDDRPNPQFVRRDHSPGAGDTPDRTRVAYSGDESDGGGGGSDEEKPPPGTSTPEEHQGDGDNPLANAPSKDTDGGSASNVRNQSIPAGDQQAQVKKAAEAACAAMEAKHLPSKKRSASRSARHSSAGDGSSRHLFSSSSDDEEEGAVFEPLEVTNDLDHQQEQAWAARAQERHTPAHMLGREPTYLRSYFPPDVNSGAQLFLERLESPRRLIGGRSKSSKGAYERALVQTQDLFKTDMEAARCVLLASHRMEPKEFASLRKKPEASGGLHPVWGYPWVQPEHTSTVPEAEALFWKWIFLKGYSAQKFPEEKTLSNILDQRDLRIQFAHLISKRQLSKEIARPKRNIGSSAHDERGYGAFASASVPSNTAKKPRVTYEAAAASAPRSRRPSGNLPGAARTAPMNSATQGTLSISPRAGASGEVAALGVPAPRGSGVLRSGRGGPTVASHDCSLEPLAQEAPKSSTGSLDVAAGLQQEQNRLLQEENRLLRDRVYALEIVTGVGPGGNAAAAAGQASSLVVLR